MPQGLIRSILIAVKSEDGMLILAKHNIICGHGVVKFFIVASPTESMIFLTTLLLVILRTMYFSMVHSHIYYGLLACGFDSNRTIKQQKRCVRIITRSTYNAHTQPLMKQLNILSGPDMLLLNSMKFYYIYKT